MISKSTSFSSFFFLRVINAALMSPEKYDLKVDKFNQFQLRKIVLISKVLQNLAKFVPFQDKDACMIPLNAFLNAKSTPLKLFIDSITQVEISKKSTRMIEYLQSTEKSPELVALACAKVQDVLKKQTKELVVLPIFPKLKAAIDNLECIKATITVSSPGSLGNSFAELF